VDKVFQLHVTPRKSWFVRKGNGVDDDAHAQRIARKLQKRYARFMGVDKVGTEQVKTVVLQLMGNVTVVESKTGGSPRLRWADEADLPLEEVRTYVVGTSPCQTHEEAPVPSTPPSNKPVLQKQHSPQSIFNFSEAAPKDPAPNGTRSRSKNTQNQPCECAGPVVLSPERPLMVNEEKCSSPRQKRRHTKAPHRRRMSPQNDENILPPKTKQREERKRQIPKEAPRDACPLKMRSMQVWTNKNNARSFPACGGGAPPVIGVR
jgi:hypothetical protein